MEQITSLQQLRNYFAEQPKETWCTFKVTNHKGQHCALGHLIKDGVNMQLFENGSIGEPLRQIGVDAGKLVMVNNGESMENPEKDPQSAVLAYIDSLINKSQWKAILNAPR